MFWLFVDLLFLIIHVDSVCFFSNNCWSWISEFELGDVEQRLKGFELGWHSLSWLFPVFRLGDTRGCCLLVWRIFKSSIAFFWWFWSRSSKNTLLAKKTGHPQKGMNGVPPDLRSEIHFLKTFLLKVSIRQISGAPRHVNGFLATLLDLLVGEVWMKCQQITPTPPSQWINDCWRYSSNLNCGVNKPNHTNSKLCVYVLGCHVDQLWHAWNQPLRYFFSKPI